VFAARDDSTPSPRLRIIVRNTGAPLAAPFERGGDHVGLDNVARRLAGHYGDDARIALVSDESGATVAELILPLPAIPSEELHAQAAASRAGRR
jgi:LytS/YehU family sensor histidine kinase